MRVTVRETIGKIQGMQDAMTSRSLLTDNAAILLYKPCKQNVVVLQFEISALSVLFEYLCYGSTAIKICYSFGDGIDYKRQSMTCIDVIL